MNCEYCDRPLYGKEAEPDSGGHLMHWSCRDLEIEALREYKVRSPGRGWGGEEAVIAASDEQAAALGAELFGCAPDEVGVVEPLHSRLTPNQIREYKWSKR